jgi:hypothetical protein
MARRGLAGHNEGSTRTAEQAVQEPDTLIAQLAQERGISESALRDWIKNAPKTRPWWLKVPPAAVVIGAISTVCVVARLLSVAGTNTITAYGILQAQTTTNIIIGTLIALTPLILVSVGCAAALFSIFGDVSGYEATVGITSSFFLIAIATLLAPFYLALNVFYIGIVLLYVLIRKSKFRAEWEQTRSVGKKLMIPVAILFVACLVASAPWLPSQQFVFKKSGDAVIGYILTENNGKFTVLQENRLITTISGSSLAKPPFICIKPSTLGYAPIYYIRHYLLSRPNYPSCG